MILSKVNEIIKVAKFYMENYDMAPMDAVNKAIEEIEEELNDNE